MIRTKSEYDAAVERSKAMAVHLANQERLLREKGLTELQLKNALDPMRSFRLRLAEDIAAFKRFRQSW